MQCLVLAEQLVTQGIALLYIKNSTSDSSTVFVGISIVPHSRSGAVPMSSLSGVGQLGFWEIGKGGTTG
jgi:hypothetical protein